MQGLSSDISHGPKPFDAKKMTSRKAPIVITIRFHILKVGHEPSRVPFRDGNESGLDWIE
jgi:hypothetical protein